MRSLRPTARRWWAAATAITLLAVAGAGPGSWATAIRAGSEPVSPVPASPGSGATGQPRVSLSGPFGTLDGLPIPVGGPLPEVAPLRALDAYGRGATLLAAPRDVRLVVTAWQLRATLVSGPGNGTVVTLGGDETSLGGYASVPAPPTGAWVIRLDASLDDADQPFRAPPVRGSWIWLVVVPDRDVPQDDPNPPVPQVVLATGTTGVAMELGSGCYLGTCGDIGHPSPDELLPDLSVVPAARMRLALSDGSGLGAWSVAVRRVGAPDDAAVPVVSDALGVSRPLVQFSAPGVGSWVVAAQVSFDLERGGFAAFARLEVR